MQSILPIISGNPLAFDRKLSRIVFNSWLSKIDSVKHRNHRFADFVHRLKAGGLAHSQVLNNKITDNSICKHVNSCKTFLILGSKAKLTSGIGLGAEVIIVCPHSVQIVMNNFLDIW
jgi:hypothetical protein